jgi:hypothetical protein
VINASLPDAAVLALSLAQAARDTVFVVQAKPGWQLWIEGFAAVATIVVALALLFAGAGAIYAGLKVKQLTKKVEAQAQKLRADAAPAVRHVTTAAENLQAVSATVKENAARLGDTVADANRRLRDAADAAEERLGEFNALLGVVQEEAEGLFIGSASTARGLRAGAHAFRRFRGDDTSRGRREFDDDDEYLDDDDGYEGDDDAFDDEPPPRARRARNPLQPRAAMADDEDFEAGEVHDDDLTDDDLTDEELEIRVARRDARRGIDPDRVF